MPADPKPVAAIYDDEYETNHGYPVHHGDGHLHVHFFDDEGRRITRFVALAKIEPDEAPDA